jgi:hypothetical protein
MTVSDFANHYRLKLIHDSCGDPIIQGRLGKDSNISEFSIRNPDQPELAMCWLTDGRRTGGMRLHQEGDAEGIFVFDP